MTDSVPSPALARPGNLDELRIYRLGAIVALAVTFAGFAPTYYLKSAYPAPQLDTLRHLHGIVMTAWFGLFLAQTHLVATNRVYVHRKPGIAGALLAIIVVIMGVALGIASARSGANPAGVPPKVFLVLPFGEMLAFATLVGAAITLRTRPEFHKRLMLLATLAMLAPAIARLPIAFLHEFGPPAHFALTDLLILAFVGWDTARHRKMHPAFVAGLAFILFVQAGRLAVSRTRFWDAFATWLIG